MKSIEEKKKHAIFCIRYSILIKSTKAWKISQTDPETYKNSLFDPLRLKFRRETFARITMPSIFSAIENSPSIHSEIHVLTSIYLPDEDKKFLNDLASNNKLLKIFYYDENNTNLEASIENYVDNFVADGEMVASIRIDDDDGISSDFLMQLNNYLRLEFKGFILSICKGYAILLNDENEVVKIAKYKWRFAAAGLAYIYEKNNLVKHFSIYQCGSHTTTDERFPSILDSRSEGIIRSFHQYNDRMDDFNKLKSISKPEELSSFKDKFKLDLKLKFDETGLNV
jgi:hypothetical protein